MGEQRVRIVAGRWRGRPIAAPKGSVTRPTADRVREALFSSLTCHFGSWEDVTVLDAYAGSGALGLEALSRGASHATFVEKDRRVMTTLEQNIQRLDAGLLSTVIGSDVSTSAAQVRLGHPVSLLLLDPPYRINKSEVRGLIEALDHSHRLVQGAVIVWEHASNEDVEWPSFVDSHDRRRYGSTTLDVGIAHVSEEKR